MLSQKDSHIPFPKELFWLGSSGRGKVDPVAKLPEWALILTPLQQLPFKTLELPIICFVFNKTNKQEETSLDDMVVKERQHRFLGAYGVQEASTSECPIQVVRLFLRKIRDSVLLPLLRPINKNRQFKTDQLQLLKVFPTFTLQALSVFLF